MADIRIDAVRKQFGAMVALKQISLDVRDGEFVALLGPSGCGKTTLAAHRRRAGDADIRPRADRRPRRLRSAAARPRTRDGVSELRGVSAHDGAAERGVRSADAGADSRSHHAAGAALGRAAAYRGAARPLSGAVVRRAAAARCRGAGAGRRAGGAADGRAAVESRRAAAPGNARRAESRAGGGGNHHALRHARSDRGDGSRRPHRGDA